MPTSASLTSEGICVVCSERAGTAPQLRFSRSRRRLRIPCSSTLLRHTAGNRSLWPVQTVRKLCGTCALTGMRSIWLSASRQGVRQLPQRVELVPGQHLMQGAAYTL